PQATGGRKEYTDDDGKVNKVVEWFGFKLHLLVDVRHEVSLSYIGHEPQRQTIKYRCPAMHDGWECPMAKICNAGKSYGLTVRVPQEIDVRRRPASPSPVQRTTIPPSIQRLTGPVPRPFADSLPPETDRSFFRWSYGSALPRVPRQSAPAHSLLRNTYPSGVPPAKPRQRNRLHRRG
ncbi:MAG: hypothetical protein HYV60_21990, partial [Planctomycetia bacterium]|nr:hypothetical protein [Planctomycetia bacterium]